MEVKREVQSSVKDEHLIEKRREQIIRGAVKLFREKGFHRATTREIAQAAGFSIGTLYEYIRTKEDVLFLVCDSIYHQVQDRLSSLEQEGTIEGLKRAVRSYYQLIDDMSDEFVVMYQESKSLPKDALRYVLKKEMEMVGIIRNNVQAYVTLNGLALNERAIDLAAHHIVVQGQMWAFRRWALRQQYTIEEFIDMQLALLFKGLTGENN